MSDKLTHDCCSEKYPQFQHCVSKRHLIRRRNKGTRVYAQVVYIRFFFFFEEGKFSRFFFVAEKKKQILSCL